MAGLTVVRRGIAEGRGSGGVQPLVFPSGGDDTALINAAMAAGRPLAPKETFLANAALLVAANGVLRGGGGRGNTIIKATAGNFTNGPLNAAPFMLKWNGGDQWAHGVRVTGIKFDTSAIAGLGAMWLQEPGENSWFDDLRCDSTVATKRTVADAQITGSNVVTFTASTFIEDDVNGFVTDRTDGDYTQAGPTIPALTKIDRVNYANPIAFPPQTTATSITLSNAATGSASNSSFSIYRPTSPFVFDGGGATGRIGTLNGILNQGPLLWQKNQVSGSWTIDELSGDSNWGNNHRISRAGNSGNQVAITVKHLKAENSQAGANAALMDPVVLLDRCDMLTYMIETASIIPGAGGGRDVVRIDQPQTRPPIITLDELEGDDPFNNTYTNIIHDSSSGEVIPAWTGTLTSSGGVVTGPRPYPLIVWARDILLGGGAKIPKYQRRAAVRTFLTPPFAAYNSATWLRQYNATAIAAYAQYNSSSAQNDGGAWQVDLSAGVWRMTLAGTKANNQAIATIDFSIDGGSTWTAIGTADQYNATATQALWDFSGISVPVDGTVLVRFQALTRNASNTTGWIIALSGMEWARTA